MSISIRARVERGTRTPNGEFPRNNISISSRSPALTTDLDDSQTKILLLEPGTEDGTQPPAVPGQPSVLSGCDCIRARDPVEGLKRVRAEDPDLALVVDNRDPATRDEIFEYLGEYAAEIPVVVVTDEQRPGLEHELQARGATSVTESERLEDELLLDYVSNAVEPLCESRHLRRLQRAIASAQEGVVVSDANADDNPIVYCNESFERMTGYPAGEVVGRNCRFLQCDETSEERVAAVREAIDEGVPITIELLNERRNGERFWNELSITPVRNKNGDVTDYLGFQRDVTRRVEAERKLERYQRTVEHLTDLVVIKDEEGRYLLANSRAAELLGTTREEMVGTVDSEFVGPSTANQFRRQARRAVEQDEPVTQTMEVDAEGGNRMLKITRVPYREHGEVVGTVGVARDVTEEEMLRKRLERRLRYDDLTGLPNRRLLLDRIEVAMKRACESGLSKAVGMIELDDFRAVNETFGRDRGDDLLRRIAGRIETTVGTDDVVGRLSGDEFGLLLRSASKPSDVRSFARRLDRNFDEPFEVDGVPVHVPLSAGFSVTEVAASDDAFEASAKHELRGAKRAADEAKSVRGFSWRICESEPERQFDVRIKFEDQIRRGLERDEFEPHFQPIYSLREERLWAAELLARWDHPEQGHISPAEFIPPAEKAGLLQPLTETLVRQAGEQMTERDIPEAWSRPVRLFLNLSPSQVARRDLAARMEGLVEAHFPDVVDVGLEITESQFIDRRETIASLRDAGFLVAIDDFGTGHASLIRLKEIPMDVLKLDMAFVHSAVETEEDRAILEAATELGRQLGVQMIGEGVETEKQLSVLEKSGSTAAQGHLLGRPVPYEQLVDGTDSPD